MYLHCPQSRGDCPPATVTALLSKSSDIRKMWRCNSLRSVFPSNPSSSSVPLTHTMPWCQDTHRSWAFHVSCVCSALIIKSWISCCLVWFSVLPVPQLQVVNNARRPSCFSSMSWVESWLNRACHSFTARLVRRPPGALSIACPQRFQVLELLHPPGISPSWVSFNSPQLS